MTTAARDAGAPPGSGSAVPGGRLPALDGVRGVAILLVLAIHLWRPEMSTAVGRGITKLASLGWVGVDLFFVLSGFLITGLLVDGRGRRGSLVSFYARRVLRIVPLYALFVVISLGLMPTLVAALGIGAVPGLGYAADAAEWPWYAGFASNAWMALEGSFPAAFANGPTWSLAVEEQFYLLWPWIVLLCPPRHLATALGLTVAVSVALRLVAVAAFPGVSWVALFVLTPFRLDGLALGGLLAVWLRRGHRRALRWTARLGLGLALPVVVAWMLLLGQDPRQSAPFQVAGYLLVALAGAGLVAALVVAEGPLRRALSVRPLLSFGRHSYAIYLFHLLIFTTLLPVFYRPVVAVAGSGLAERFFWLVTGTAASWLTAWLLHHLWERHFLRLKDRFRQPVAPATVPASALPAVTS